MYNDLLACPSSLRYIPIRSGIPEWPVMVNRQILPILPLKLVSMATFLNRLEKDGSTGPNFHQVVTSMIGRPVCQYRWTMGWIWVIWTLLCWTDDRLDEMRWDEMRWDEMRWDEMRWDEMRYWSPVCHGVHWCLCRSSRPTVVALHAGCSRCVAGVISGVCDCVSVCMFMSAL